jgi:predicted enzyme related to lactoylglutathione lyase
MNHIDLHVTDVAATSGFLTRYFGLTLRETRGRNFLAILNDDDGFEIVISQPIEKLGGRSQDELGGVTYHIGFIQNERADVDVIFDRLQDRDAELIGEPKELRGGYVFYCLAPGRILVEVGWRPQ